MFQRRVDGNEDFYRDWKEYEFGFGNKSYDHWLGELCMDYFLLLFCFRGVCVGRSLVCWCVCVCGGGGGHQI